MAWYVVFVGFLPDKNLEIVLCYVGKALFVVAKVFVSLGASFVAGDGPLFQGRNRFFKGVFAFKSLNSKI